MTDRIYSFQADSKLGERIERAGQTLAYIGRLETPASEWIAREMQLALFRRAHEIAESDNRSELMRTTMEVLVDATEKVEDDLRFADAYAESARPRTADDEEFLEAAQWAGAALWRDE